MEATVATFKHILCPIDLSEASAHAVEQAIAFAHWTRATVTVLYVYEPLYTPIPGLPSSDYDITDEERERTRVRAARFMSELVQDGASNLEIAVGHPARVIVQDAMDLPADLIVMGTHGASGFERLILGSVTEMVLRHAPCPVLTVPLRAHATSHMPLRRILCAIDFSDWSLAAVDIAASLAEQAGAALDLLHVIEWPWQEPPPPDFAQLPIRERTALFDYRRYAVSSAQHRLDALWAEKIGDRCLVKTHVVHGKPYVETLRLADEARVDLIVLGVHGRSRLELVVFGSTTNHIVRNATCPVLTVRR